MLLIVLDSEGSSPGRQGFKMAVSADNDLWGSIGGGIMEHKLVEKTRAMLVRGDSEIGTLRQHHDKQHTTGQSGMICSGSQLIAFVPVGRQYLPLLRRIVDDPAAGYLVLSSEGLKLESELPGKILGYVEKTSGWEYREWLHDRPVVHIFGAGHVGLALSEVLHFLGFYIKNL